MRRCLLVLVLFFCGSSLYAQKPISIQIKDPIVCYATAQDHPHYIAPPQAYLNKKNNPSARTNSAVFEVTYIGFASVPQAQQAFQRAIDIWSALLTSSVPIRIQVRWTTLDAGVLGSANYTSAIANFKGAQKIGVFYPIAIAEKITGREMNEGAPDIIANFNSTFNWHFNPDDHNVVAGKYDLTTVVLHEIGHGLGFSGSLTVSSGQGVFGFAGTGIPMIYDIPIETSGASNLIETKASPSVALATSLLSNNLFSDTLGVGHVKLYAPSTFDPGSSVSHLDESLYNLTANALMTPQIASQEQHNDPGIALNMLQAFGWEIIRIDHTQLPGTEDVSGPYPVTVNIVADKGYDDESVMLHYTIDGESYTDVVMTPSGPANTYTANIPGNGSASDYGYYISVNNTTGFQYVNPGKSVTPLAAQTQRYYVFSTGPDTQAPKIIHSKKLFLLDTETELIIDAFISDNTGSVTAHVDYSINGVPQLEKLLSLRLPEEDSVYTTTINFSGLANGDEITYRIVATDHAEVPNTAYAPSASESYILQVVGLGETQDSYENDFELTERDGDFFGSGYSITQASGFTDRAIHSEHPYGAGNGFPNNERDLIYQLRFPIRVQSAQATLKFDEVVLVEPGDAGSVFGDNNFYDYVIVEGSLDGGQTWEFLLDGYDSRDQSTWLTRWNSAVDANGNSTAVGVPSLYRQRTIDLLETFEEDDEVVIRFRLYSDQLATGWGWAIDNVKIQIDETPPLILHDHVDFLTDNATEIALPSEVSDISGLSQYSFEVFVNDGDTQTIDFDIDPLPSRYNFTLDNLESLAAGDVLQYRFVAEDSKGNVSTFPASGYIKVPILSFGTAITEYSSNFNSANTDFVGNFFSITEPAGFAEGAIHSDHFYPLGMGLDQTSNFSYMLKNPVTISADNPIIRFDEIVLVEGHANGVVFGTAAFNDYVIVEGSTDNGETWTGFTDGYDAVGVSQWVSAVGNQSNGTPALFRTRTLNMTQSGDFAGGDNVLIRFRLFSNQTLNAWGWAIDNLLIQNPVTGVENPLESAVSVHPNPTTENILIEAAAQASPEFAIQLITPQGQKIYEAKALAVDGKLMHTIAASNLAAGMYLLTISNGGKSVIRKVIKSD